MHIKEIVLFDLKRQFTTWSVYVFDAFNSYMYACH